MVKHLKETENLIGSIKSIIHDYPSDSSLFKEFLQNSDDAGAKEQTFILDSRIHGTETIVDPRLAESQGPALLCLNESVFEDSNWKAISSARSSDKLSDASKTGKYGVGFRSCYHVTDNPHVLSGDTLLVLDPHYAFATYPGGLMIDVPSERDRYPDQFAPFAPMLSADHYPGTVIRLPLRTENQAKQARDANKALGGPVATLRMKKLISNFMKSEAATCLLFLRNINTITYKEIDKDGTCRTIATVKLEIIHSENKVVNQGENNTVDQAEENAVDHAEYFECLVTASSSDGDEVKQYWLIITSEAPEEDVVKIFAAYMEHKQTTSDIQRRLAQEKLRSRVSIAFPLDTEMSNGKLFTLLPLPILTKFPVHINGSFSLMSNRQRLDVVEGKQASLNLDAWIRVQWNYFIFEQLLPPLWARLLSILVYEKRLEDPWKAWPRISPGDTNCYWIELPKLVLETFKTRGYSILPVVEGGSPIKLDKVLVSDSTLSPDLLKTLKHVGMHIVSPPLEVLEVVRLVNHRRADPDTVCSYMRDNLAVLVFSALDGEGRNLILDYFLDPSEPSSLRRTIQLPLLPTVDGSFIAPSERDCFISDDMDTAAIVLLLAQEEELFADLPNASNMIPLSKISPRASALVSRPEANSYLAVSLLRSAHAGSLLEAKLGGWIAESEHDTQTLAAWLVSFWQWIPTWDGSRDLLASDSILELPLVPSRTGTIRRPKDGIFYAGSLEAQLAPLLAKLGIPVSHEDLLVKEMETVCKPSRHVGLVLGHLDPQALVELQDNDLSLLRQYMLDCLKYSTTNLPPAQRNILFSLPIFTVLEPQASGSIDALELRPIQGHPIYIDVLDCPLPLTSTYPAGITYVKVTDSGTRTLVERAHGSDRPPFFDELKILETAIPLLEQQPAALLEKLFIRIMHRFLDIPDPARKILRSVPFVPVSHGRRKQACEVVDPSSRLADLYQDEAGRFPYGCTEDMLHALRSYEFLVSTIDEAILRERIHYISQTSNSKTYQKAKVLLQLLNSSSICAVLSVETKNLLRQHAWLPCHHNQLCQAQNCRDISKEEGPFLFDTVLKTLDGAISNPHVRQSINWPSSLPFSILATQFRTTLFSEDDKISSTRLERLRALCRRFRDLFNAGRLTEANLTKLREPVGSTIRWFPFIGDELVATRYLLLSDECPVGQVSNFRVLSKTNVGEWRGFLQGMHCSERPTAKALLRELQILADGTVPVLDLKSCIDQNRRLLELFVHFRYPIEPSQLLAPDADGVFHPLDQLQYNDIGLKAPSLETSAILHPSISRELAENLNVQFVSSALLGEDDHDIEDLEMGEDLGERIAGVLKKYSIGMVANELLANAIDADASTFSIQLDQRTFPNAKDLLPTKEMQEFQLAPSLFFHNDAMFGEEDFLGICRIGQGGKSRLTGTIGRFGIGALSMFHFTKVVMLVSGGYMQILDPSGDHLPPHPSGRKRTALRRKLSDIASKYPHLLTPFQGVLGFPISLSDLDEHGYEGTIFRLPLKHDINIHACLSRIEKEYHTSARHAFFFNHILDFARAYHRRATDIDARLVWDISGHVASLSCGDQKDETIMNAYQLMLTVDISGCSQNANTPGSCAVTSERWLIVQAVDPVAKAKEYRDVLEAHRYASHQHLTSQLAFHLSSTIATRAPDHHLFSRLMIPQTINLPFHLDAPFALSDDRRNIRFENVQGLKSREAKYNTLLLSEVIPALYHFGLSVIVAQPEASTGSVEDVYNRWWPHEDLNNEVSSVLAQGFYNLLPTTTYPVFIASRGSPICPQDALFYFSKDLSPAHCDTLQAIFSRLIKERFVGMPHPVRKSLRDRKIPLLSITALICKQVLQAKDHELVGLNLTPKEVGCLLEVLYSGKSNTSPLDTRLLLTEDGTLRLFEAQGTAVFDLSHYQGQRGAIVDTFSKKWFLHHGIPAILENMYLFTMLLTTVSESFLMKLDYIKSSVHFHTAISVRSILRLSRNPTGPERLQWSELDDADLEDLAGRIKTELESSTFVQLEDDLLQVLRKYPIWTAFACGGATNRRATAEELCMLAEGLAVKSISPYIRPTITIAQFSAALHIVMGSTPGCIIQRERLVDFIDMPSHKVDNSQAALEGFKRVLLVVLDSIGSQPSQLRLPDTALVMKRPQELYDSSIPLFRKAFTRRSGDRLLHHSLEDLQPRLRSIGLQHEITRESLFQCTKVLHEELSARQDGSSIGTGEELLEVAQLIYEQYLGMPESALWTEYRGLSFIPRRASRRTAYPFDDIDQFSEPLPLVTSPNLVLVPTQEQVCWTQRACLAAEPPLPVQSLDWTLGIPTAAEVVSHLSVLATRLLQKHPESDLLLNDLQATYQWLSSNSEHARQPLVMKSNEPLFLNIDDLSGAKDRLTWKSANQLVLGLRYDEGNLCSVRAFLEDYRPLLRAAGVKTWLRPEYSETPARSQDDRTDLRRAHNCLRAENMLLDWKILPERSRSQMETSPEDFPDGPLRCHRAFMAASISYLKVALASEDYGEEYPEDASYFAVASLIDFVYTGELTVKEPQDGKEAKGLLEDLLELLSLADRLNLESLKRKVGASVHKYGLISPDTLRGIREAAEIADLAPLKEYCTELKAENAETWSMQDH